MKDLTFNGISYDAFLKATSVVASYLNGVSSLPLDEENEHKFMMTAIGFLPLSMANKSFLDRIASLKELLENKSNNEQEEDNVVS